MSNADAGPWDLTRLQLFLTVVREGSLTRAASVTGSPQPAISRQIARLEAQCGGRLFLRTGRGVVLSPLGERVMPRVLALLHGAEALSAEVEQGSAPIGDVRIGALPSLYLSLVLPLFESLRKRTPGIKLHVLEGSAGQIDQWLASGVVDIGLPYRYGALPAGDERLALASSFLIGPPGDALTAAQRVPFAKLDRLPLVLPSAPSGVRLVLDKLARKAGITLDVVMEADSTQIQRAAPDWGAYAVLPMHAVASEVADGRLQAALVVEPTIDRVIALSFASGHPATQATREVAHAIRQIVQSTRDLPPMPESA